MKIAQYEVLGNGPKEVPSRRDERTVAPSPPNATSRVQTVIDRPYRDGHVFLPLPSNKLLGYFHWVPSGPLLSAYTPTPYDHFTVWDVPSPRLSVAIRSMR
jgi:hypothetical protein